MPLAHTCFGRIWEFAVELVGSLSAIFARLLEISCVSFFGNLVFPTNVIVSAIRVCTDEKSGLPSTAGQRIKTCTLRPPRKSTTALHVYRIFGSILALTKSCCVMGCIAYHILRILYEVTLPDLYQIRPGIQRSPFASAGLDYPMWVS